MNRYMNDPCIIGPEIFFPLNMSLDRNAAISDCSEGSLSPTVQITQISVSFLIDDWGGYVYMQHNIGIGSKTNRSGVQIPSCPSFLPALLTTFSAVELTYVSDSENKDCCGYFILCAMFLEMFYNLVQ